MAVNTWRRVYSTAKRAEEYPLLMKVAGGKWHADMLGAAVSALALLKEQPERIIELGTGTGKLAGRLLRAWPRARLSAVDGSEAMLAKARENLRGFGSRAEFLRRDFGAARWSSGLPEACAVVSTIAIHHLSDAGKRRLYREVFQLLRPGGIFVHGDALRHDEPVLRKKDDFMWGTAIRARMRASGGRVLPVGEVVAWIDRTRRAEGDLPASLASHLDWLRGAGFVQVDCWWKTFGFAVFGGVKP